MKNKMLKRPVLLLSIILILGFSDNSIDKKNGNIKINNTNSNEASIGDSYRMYINKIAMPMNSKGVMADVVVGDGPVGGRIDDKVFLFSGGFMMSGVDDQGVMWANGVASASRIEDYEAGNASWNTTDDRQETDQTYAGMYLVRSSDPPFGEVWQNWGVAVEAGAYFYDGDDDGVYNPVDKNGNGVWDPEEDSPDILGDETIWCVYNDAVQPAFRNWQNVNPQGIEIRQTIWAYDTVDELSNVMFIRYSLLNTGLVSEVHEDVYFSVWADPDLGDYGDDLVGSDPILNAGYVYNDGDDDGFGVNPPCFIVDYLQGPWVETGNPTDFALNVKGPLLGVDTIWGNANAGLSSFIHYIYGNINLDDPADEIVARNYMLGLDMNGNFIDPCSWELGTVYNDDCSSIDPTFLYSGDPVSVTGWINNIPADQRQMLNTGPISLVKDKPVDIIVAYIVGRGTNALNSIIEAKAIARDVIGFYETAFSYVPVGVKEVTLNTLPREFSLSQNYPNPFNPATKISYSIPKQSNVTIKVFDVLGREVESLVNEQQKPAYYEVKFEGSNLTSGIYFYRIQAGDFVDTKKMILMK